MKTKSGLRPYSRYKRSFIYWGGSYLRSDQSGVLSIVQSGIQATRSKLNVQWIKKRLEAKLIIERSTWGSGAANRVKGEVSKGIVRGNQGSTSGNKWEENKHGEK